jgi:prepilin-type N-terminal cleavage/methylation domain-containing protein
MFAQSADARIDSCKDPQSGAGALKSPGRLTDNASMTRTLARLRSRRGFSLIELLVTILLLAILSAIALPAYLQHQKKGKDSDAQSNVRNLTSRIELCYATQEAYTDCDDNTKLGGDTGLPYGTDPGEVSVVSATTTGFKVTAISKASSDGSNHTYTLEKDIAGVTNRTCTAGSTNKSGGCRSGVW